MRRALLIGSMFSLLALFPGSTVAAPVNATIGQVQSQSSAKAPPQAHNDLSEEECTGLGGTNMDSAASLNCKSGRMCVRADKNGVLHQSCINATAH
jgi:hypothetical protein